MNEPLRFTCPNCLTEWDEPECDGCGRNLAGHSRRIPGAPTPEALERVRRIYGEMAALQVVSDGAISTVLRMTAEEQRREADHYDTAKELKW